MVFHADESHPIDSADSPLYRPLHWSTARGFPMEYRKRKGKEYDTWHWREDCPQWPTSGYKARNKKPKGGGQELCDTCRDLEDKEVVQVVAAEVLTP